MITFFNIAVVFLLSVISTSIFPHLRIFGVAPILTLFFIIQLSYFRKGIEPLLLAAAAGIFFDLFSPYFFGLYLILFVGVASIVRYFFGEGLRTLNFGHYITISAISMVLYMGSQIVVLLIHGIKPGLNSLLPLGLGILINLIFATLLYFFGTWYFEQMLILEDRQKRR